MIRDTTQCGFSDPRWFPVDLDVRTREFLFLRIDEATLDGTPFIDNRIGAPLGEAERVSADRIDFASQAVAETGWLWHTSFCGSSLLARALHVMPRQVALKEPLILRRLGDARDRGYDLTDTVGRSARLLARPWHSGGGVVIKPTHAALNVAVDLMQSLPDTRAVLLHSELEDFLFSNIKKSRETQERIGLLAERALRATSLFPRLPPEASNAPDFLCAAAIQWVAQRELGLDILELLGASRLRTLAATSLYADLCGTALSVQQWLGLPSSAVEVEARVAQVGSRNAKDFAQPYDVAKRTLETTFLRERHGLAVVRAMRWCERLLLPHMRKHAFVLPLPLSR